LEIGEADAGYETRDLVLSEAESSMEWYQAIESKDCKTLMTLLEEKRESALLLKTGKAGRTALHVAAIQGSLELLNTIRGLLISKANLRDCLTRAIDGRCKMKAEEIAYDIIGYSSRVRKAFTFEDLKRGDEAFTPDSELSAEWRSQYELTRNDIKSIEQVITSVLTTYEGRYKGLMDSFQQNVDYNFGSGNLFLFHHACSRVDGGEFVEDVILRYSSFGIGEVQLKKLMQLRDFQGRTPLHVAVAVAPAKDRDHVLENIIELLGHRPTVSWDTGPMWEMSLWKYLGVRDGRGWTPLHLAATQLDSYVFLDRFVYIADLQKFEEFDDMTVITLGADAIKTEEICTALHLAVLHNNTEFVRVIRDFVRDPDNWRNMISRRIKYEKSDIEGWSVLALALLLGNQDIVDILLSAQNVTKNEVIVLFQ
jgi:ankyrin repeat protein